MTRTRTRTKGTLAEPTKSKQLTKTIPLQFLLWQRSFDYSLSKKSMIDIDPKNDLAWTLEQFKHAMQALTDPRIAKPLLNTINMDSNEITAKKGDLIIQFLSKTTVKKINMVYCRFENSLILIQILNACCRNPSIEHLNLFGSIHVANEKDKKLIATEINKMGKRVIIDFQTRAFCNDALNEKKAPSLDLQKIAEKQRDWKAFEERMRKEIKEIEAALKALPKRATRIPKLKIEYKRHAEKKSNLQNHNGLWQGEHKLVNPSELCRKVLAQKTIRPPILRSGKGKR